ncbi:hypothetical protein BDV96DRAFT_289226 [Lophiotrema nucula]|uniref:Uncharacterized protein n=1 Tax=Lophiotrema nucula TaxID=690887 RepID=A0A6A5YL86_9PLEO|nr:hypothetical protein BDV96DRAFT_289226 [Lophiotrema nucula]
MRCCLPSCRANSAWSAATAFQSSRSDAADTEERATTAARTCESLIVICYSARKESRRGRRGRKVELGTGVARAGGCRKSSYRPSDGAFALQAGGRHCSASKRVRCSTARECLLRLNERLMKENAFLAGKRRVGGREVGWCKCLGGAAAGLAPRKQTWTGAWCSLWASCRGENATFAAQRLRIGAELLPDFLGRHQ